MRLPLLATLLTSLTLTSLAAAQPSKAPDPRAMAASDCARARKAGATCVLSIDEGETLEGTAPTAGGTTITARPWVPVASLIRLRRDFITEILRSAEDLD